MRLCLNGRTDPHSVDPDGLLCVCAYTQALDANAKDKSLGQCAKYVRTALEAGGADTRNRPVSAKDYGALLERNGFVKVSTTDYQPGDTAVFDSYKGGSVHGHVQGTPVPVAADGSLTSSSRAFGQAVPTKAPTPSRFIAR